MTAPSPITEADWPPHGTMPRARLEALFSIEARRAYRNQSVEPRMSIAEVRATLVELFNGGNLRVHVSTDADGAPRARLVPCDPQDAPQLTQFRRPPPGASIQ